jgi:hypothetical protein
VRLLVLAAVKKTFFRAFMPCELVRCNQRFGETLSPSSIPEDGDIMLLRNTGMYPRVHTASECLLGKGVGGSGGGLF